MRDKETAALKAEGDSLLALNAQVAGENIKLREALEICAKALSHQSICACKERGWGQHEEACDALDKAFEIARAALGEK